jgi:hypothetical protein
MTFATKILPDGRIVKVVPLTLGRARIIVGDGHTFVDDSW